MLYSCENIYEGLQRKYTFPPEKNENRSVLKNICYVNDPSELSKLSNSHFLSHTHTNDNNEIVKERERTY